MLSRLRFLLVRMLRPAVGLASAGRGIPRRCRALPRLLRFSLTEAWSQKLPMSYRCAARCYVKTAPSHKISTLQGPPASGQQGGFFAGHSRLFATRLYRLKVAGGGKAEGMVEGSPAAALWSGCFLLATLPVRRLKRSQSLRLP